MKIKAAALPNSVKNSGKQLVLTRSLIAGLASLDIEAISLETDARVVKELASYSYLVFVVETDFSGHLPSNIELLLSRGDVKGKKCYVYVAKKFIGAKYALKDLVRMSNRAA